MKEVYDLLCTNVVEVINSPIEAAAAVNCGIAASMLVTLDSDNVAVSNYNADRDRTWSLAAKSPFSSEHAAQAKKYLADAENTKGARPQDDAP